jgi:hypothetical protein
MLLLVCYLCFHDDLGAGGGGGVEGDEQEVQVGSEAVHAGHLAGQSTDNGRHCRGCRRWGGKE